MHETSTPWRRMTEFVPPPGYTTLRFDWRISAEDARNALESFLADDLKLRDIFSFQDFIEPRVELHPTIPDVLLVPVQKLDKAQPVLTEIIVDRSCGAAVLRGAHIFLSGIIAAPQSLKRGDDVSVYVDLKKKCLKGSFLFQGERYFIGNGVSEVARKELFSSSDHNISGIGVRMTGPIYLAPCFSSGALPKFFFPQNLPSVVVGHVLNPPPGAFVLDMCAAPGGKATHLYSLMRGTGKVLALDRSKAKVEKIVDNAKRLGYIENFYAYGADSRKIVSDLALGLDERSDNNFSPPYKPGSFSHIILDAPCSALGQRPCFPNDVPKLESAIASYPALQWQLFKIAVKLLSENGKLVYSTCTTAFEENEQMVERALKEYSNLSLLSQSPHIGNMGRKDASDLPEDALEKLQYFEMHPTDRQTSHPADKDTIGFFIASFVKS